MKSLFSKSLAVVAACTTLLAAPAAHAQKWITTGFSDVSSGLEGGGGRQTSTGRAATKLTAGADLRVDEDPENIYGAGAVVALEPRTAFGLEAHYTRDVGETLAFSGGVIGFLQPGSLVGPKAGCEYHHHLSKSFVLTAGPEFAVFVFGTDLPDKTILWEATFHVGLRVAF